jgi:hypothetical protein
LKATDYYIKIQRAKIEGRDFVDPQKMHWRMTHDGLWFQWENFRNMMTSEQLAEYCAKL